MWSILSLPLLHIDLRPSRQSRNRCIQSKISRYNLHRGRVEFGANATLTGSRWMSNNYITQCHREFKLVGVSCSWSSSCGSRQWEPAPSGELGPQDPRLSSPAEWEKKCCYSQRNWGSIYCSLFSLHLTSHTQPFRNPFATISNKVWEVYFSKVCSFVIIVDYVSALICV